MTFKKESFWGTVSYIIFFYLKNAPFKLLLEIIINVSKQVMVVITSVWLLKLLSEMIVNGMLFGDLIIPLVAVSAINIVINLGDSFYSNYVRPQNDLKIKVRFERQLSDHSNKLPLTVFENSDFYTVVEQAKEGVSVVFSAYNDFILIISQIAAVVSAVGVVISIDPLLLIFASFSVPMIILNKKTGVKIASKKMDLKYYERKETYAKEIWLKKEYVREFKTSNASKIADKHYEEGYEGAISTQKNHSRQLIRLSFFSSLFSITFVTILSYFYCVVRFSLFNSIDVPSVSVIVVAIMNMISRTRKIYNSYGNICGYQVYISALKTFLSFEPEAENKSGEKPGSFLSMEFKNVCFAYHDNEWVLKDVSFQINKGDLISIVGYNGAGKTTIIKLLLRFYDVDSGEILYNGVNINRYDLFEYRKQFAAAFQDYQLYSVTLAENLLMSEYMKSEKKQIIQVLRDVKMEHLIGEEQHLIGREYDNNGIVFSGGQAQKIAVNRLNFQSFEIALLDEPSSALDPVSSLELIKNILEVVKGKTMIIISHDMSVSKLADKILFFENGNLNEIGSHYDLMKLNGRYAAFFKTQAEPYLMDKEEKK